MDLCQRKSWTSQNSGKFTILEDKSIQTMMSLVEKGIVDCALADSLSCAQFIGSAIENQQLLSDIFAATPIHVEDNALMVAKDNPDFVDWLKSMELMKYGCKLK